MPTDRTDSTESAAIEALLQRLADAQDQRERQAIVDEAPRPWQPAMRVLAVGPEPAGAARRALGLPPIARRRPMPMALARLLHQGSYPARLCSLAPEALSVLDDDEDPHVPLDTDALADELLAAMRSGDPDDAIGRLRTREYLRLSRREVEGAPLERVGTDLSNLATACVRAALAHAGLEDRVVVFGMGKLGGKELNFLSDIDLLFVHADGLASEDSDTDRGAVIELHAALRTMVRRLEGAGRWRPVFRVDLRLRPFGSRGPLSMSVSATESYYERHGRAWERQAWLRARPIAGARALGEQMLERLRPFVYRRTVSLAIFDEVAELMARARRETRRAAGVDLKLDEGGIRTIEFALQALQLLHAGRNPSLRSPSTLRTLDRLLAAGLVSDREYRELADAYRFFRRVEHRVQLAEGNQTHSLPDDPDRRRLLAARLGTAPADEDGDDPLPAFDRQVADLRRRAQAIAATIAGDAPTTRAHVLAVLDSGAPASVRRNALESLGLRDPDEAEGLLAHVYARDDAALNARGAARRGAERLLTACLDAADPDMALVRFGRFSRDRPAHYGVWRFFAEASDPGWDLVGMTAELFGTSETLSVGLIGFPVGRGALPDDTVAVLQSAAERPLEDPTALGDAMVRAPIDPRGLDATLLRFKHQQLVRVGIHDLARRPDPLVVGKVLSDLADRVLRTVVRDLAADPAWRDGPGFDLAVLAVGKYGMQAMDYGSDLDLVFVYDAQSGDAAGAATRFSQRLIARLSDRALGMRLYEIDTRLRPSGRQGLLVTSREAFARYHARALPMWEKLAMLRMRGVCEVSVGGAWASPEPSDPDAAPGPMMAAALPGPLAADAVSIVLRHLFTTPEPDLRERIGDAVGELKRRIEDEVAREGRNAYNAKTGVGGCLELELLVSALQLVHGRENPHARTTKIDEAIAALASTGGLEPALASALSANYRFQRLLLNRLRMSHAGGFQDPDRFSENSPKLVTLARRMGLPDAEALISRYRASRVAVRRALVTTLPACGLPIPTD